MVKELLKNSNVAHDYLQSFLECAGHDDLYSLWAAGCTSKQYETCSRIQLNILNIDAFFAVLYDS